MEQTICKKIGNSGCYFLCIIYLSKTDKNIFEIYKRALNEGWITDECYMMNPRALFSYLTNRPCNLRKEFNLNYNKKNNELEISMYEWNGLTHFVVTDGDKIIYDPLETSPVVLNGVVKSKRVITL